MEWRVPTIDDAAILARAKENCARNGLRWEANGRLSLPSSGRKLAPVLSPAARDEYLTQAHKQLLDEAISAKQT